MNAYSNELLYKNDYIYINHDYNIKKIEKTILNSKLFENIDSSKLKITPIADTELYNVDLNGSSIVVNKNADYIFQGDFLSFKDGIPRKIKDYNSYEVAEKLNLFDDENLIIYSNKKEGNTKIYVFVDYTCPFCNKFHNLVIPKLVEYNIDVVLLPFPRANNKKVIDNLVSIFCYNSNEERKKELDDAYKLKTKYLSKEKCENPIYYTNIMNLGIDFKLKGTPAIFTSEGIYIGGYQEYTKILENL